MVTDLRTLAGKGLRHITINNVDSLADKGALICRETETDTIIPKSITEDLPHQDGIIDMSLDNGGKLYYEPRVLTYKFKLVGANTAELEERQAAFVSWLNALGRCTIADSKYVTNSVQQVFTNCVLKSIETESGEKSLEIEYCYLNVIFACDPYLSKQGTVNERVLKFTDNIVAGDSATIAVNDNAYTLTKSDGSTVTGTLPTGERKYRITAYSEQIPTITLGGATVQEDSIFTLPASGTITISGAGQGYFEFWHDTREVRL